MSKDELSEERIEAVRVYADTAGETYMHHHRHLPGYRARQDRADTALALIESRKQALELLREAMSIDFYGPGSANLRAAISVFLEQNQ